LAYENRGHSPLRPEREAIGIRPPASREQLR
jgi:hypothetical protein